MSTIDLRMRKNRRVPQDAKAAVQNDSSSFAEIKKTNGKDDMTCFNLYSETILQEVEDTQYWIKIR